LCRWNARSPAAPSSHHRHQALYHPLIHCASAKLHIFYFC
jgi:hypothetical protein